jgi:thiamine biosynthesis lipoprotein
MRHATRRAELGALLAVVLLTACGSNQTTAAETSRTDYALGTVCTIRILDGPKGDASAAILESAFARIREIEDEMSVNKDGSELDAVNDAAGSAVPVRVTDDVLYVLGKALEYARLTDGAFDPSVGPLVKLWGIGTESARVPSRAEIDAARRLLGWRKIEVDLAAKTVRLGARGMRLDLGAIAKGYAADEVKRILAAGKVKAAIVDLGGNVFAFGSKRDGSKWRIGVQDPASPRGDYLGIVEGTDMTVVTSGVYERFFEEGGRRYHHILDTRTGYPVDNGLVSVTIITGSSIDADGLSTALFALGREKGMALAASLPDVSVVMIDTAGKVYLSPGASKSFKLTSGSYTLSD